jgi:hypothetical protein
MTRFQFVLNPAIRQSLLELLDALCGDLGPHQVEVLKTGQTLEVLQPDVGNAGAM